jgi:alpha-L-arabinofuranosidase
MNVVAESPTYEAQSADNRVARGGKAIESIPYVDVSATFDKASGKDSVFLFNRDLAKPRDVEIVWEDAAPSRALESFTLTGPDLKAVNGFDAPEKVVPKSFDKPATTNARTRLELPARSYTIVNFAV